MALALVQEFKIVGSDRSTANDGHVAQRLDVDSNLPEGLIAQTAGWDEQGGACSASSPSGTAQTRPSR
jgi:hypothetical protein